MSDEPVSVPEIDPSTGAPDGQLVEVPTDETGAPVVAAVDGPVDPLAVHHATQGPVATAATELDSNVAGYSGPVETHILEVGAEVPLETSSAEQAVAAEEAAKAAAEPQPEPEPAPDPSAAPPAAEVPSAPEGSTVPPAPPAVPGEFPLPPRADAPVIAPGEVPPTS